MPHPTVLNHRMRILTITWPIFIETLLRLGMMTIDVLMLARYSESAVAAVGLAGNFIFFMMISYMVVSSGSAVMIGQHLGAKDRSEATAYAQSGLLLSLLSSVVVGALFFFGTSPILALYHLESGVEEYATRYLFLIGSMSIGLSVSILLSTILRAHGYSKSPMIIQVIAGIVNIVGNYVALFAPFGLPQTGVTGVAMATVASQLLAAAGCWALIKLHHIPLSFRQSLIFDKARLSKILKLGLPNAGEGMSYDLSQITIMYFIAQLGTAALAAATIGITLSRIIFVFAMSLGGGAQIQASFLVGQMRQPELKANVLRYWIAGVVISLSVAALMYFGRFPLANFFSSDVETQQLIAVVLTMALFLEPARAINLIVISALKGTGDVVFPVQVGIVSMWGIGALLAYLFGIHWAFGLAGIWLAMGLDEWIRAIIMIFRWQSEKWTLKRQT